MAAEATTPESCDPQQLSEGNPTAKWTLEQLTAYAQAQHQSIAQAEQPLTGLYWRLGKTLSMARDKFKHGRWGTFLETLGIDKTRASKAQAIYKAHRAEKDVAELSVAEAYSHRNRKKAKSHAADAAVMSDKAQLREFLKGIREEADRFHDVAAFLEPPETTEFLLDMEQTIKKLEELRDRLRTRAGN